MPVPPGTMRITFNTRLGGSEIALYGFHLNATDAEAVGGSFLEEVAKKARDSWLEAFDTYRPVFSQACVWESVRADLLSIEPGVRYLKVQDSAFAPFDQSGDNSYKGTGQYSLPWECSAVVSMAAYAPGAFEVNKGRWRGRYYLPPLAVNTIGLTTGEMLEATTTGLADTAAEFHNALNGELSDTLDDDIRTVVLSRSDDTVRVVRQVWVDSKVDAQRRRENRQPATFKRVVLLDE